MLKIGFIGGGNMGGAIIGGIRRSGMDAEIHIVDSDSAKVEALAKTGVVPCESAQNLAQECKFIFLAIKPQTFDAVLPSMKGYVTENNVLVSIAAGITEDYLISTLGVNVPCVIVMPNTPFLLGEGATALARGTYTSADDFSAVCDIFRTGGITEEISLDKMKEIIAINGSSPAFIYLYAKAFVEYAAENGIDSGKALNLFAQSLIGSAAMLTKSGKTVDELIKMVSSPGGTTLAGLDALYEGDLVGITKDCCGRCTKRAYELSK